MMFLIPSLDLSIIFFILFFRKAILQNLPQGSALGSTPFTPGTGLRNLGKKKHLGDVMVIMHSRHNL
jgi:hypothetical protein